MSFRDRLAALFSPTRKLANDEHTVLVEGGRWGGVEWVVPRAHCLYRRLDFFAVPAPQRVAAAELAVRRLHPNGDARHYLRWVDGSAQVWIWFEKLPEAPEPEFRWVPDAVLLPPLAGEGARLLLLDRGVEGQIWSGGVLSASRWWAQMPDAAQWHAFVRACGGSGEHAALPEATRLPWGREPWGSTGGGWTWSPSLLERLAWHVSALALAFLLGWQLTAAIVWNVAGWWQQTELEGMRERVAPLLAARDRAEAGLATLQAYRALSAVPDDYALMAEVVRPLPADARLNGWLRDRRRLQVQVQTGQADPRMLVSAYQGHPWLLHAVANPGVAGGSQLEFDLAAPAADVGVEAP